MAKSKEQNQMMHKNLPKEPHPQTGEPFIKGEISTETNNQLVEFYEREPTPWPREYFDDEGHEIVRSDEEMRALGGIHKAAHEAWVERGSPRGPAMHVIAGVPETTGDFWTDSGAFARGMLAPDGSWRWIESTWNEPVK